MTLTLAVAAAAEAEVTSCLCHISGRLHGLQIHNKSQKSPGACSCWVKTQTASQPGTCMNLCINMQEQIVFRCHFCGQRSQQKPLRGGFPDTVNKVFLALEKESANLCLSINSLRNHFILISQYREAAVGKTKQKTTNRPQQRRPNFTVRRRPLT